MPFHWLLVLSKSQAYSNSGFEEGNAVMHVTLPQWDTLIKIGINHIKIILLLRLELSHFLFLI
jgi:hypothetical protein